MTIASFVPKCGFKFISVSCANKKLRTSGLANHTGVRESNSILLLFTPVCYPLLYGPSITLYPLPLLYGPIHYSMAPTLLYGPSITLWPPPLLYGSSITLWPPLHYSIAPHYVRHCVAFLHQRVINVDCQSDCFASSNKYTD